MAFNRDEVLDSQSEMERAIAGYIEVSATYPSMMPGGLTDLLVKIEGHVERLTSYVLGRDAMAEAVSKDMFKTDEWTTPIPYLDQPGKAVTEFYFDSAMCHHTLPEMRLHQWRVRSELRSRHFPNDEFFNKEFIEGHCERCGIEVRLYHVDVTINGGLEFVHMPWCLLNKDTDWPKA